MGIFLLVIHLIVCIVIYILMRISVLKCTRMVMPLIVLVPVWGLGCLLVLELRARGKQEINEEVGIEKLKINDAIHRSIIMDEDPVEDRVVPLEEALLINDPSTRRELMMEIMYGNPDDYVRQLKGARMNDDTEVVHYAVTALTELQKEYDLKFQELDWEMEKNPKSRDILDRYLELLNRYLASGIPEGSERDLKLRTYSNMLEKKLEEEKDNLMLWKRKAEADLQIGEYELANEEIRKILEKWEKNETGYLLLIQYYSAILNRAGIDKTLAVLEKKRIHLSPEGRQAVRFWRRNEGAGF